MTHHVACWLALHVDDQVRNHPAPEFWLWDVTAALLLFELSGIAEAYKENRQLGNHIL